MNISSFQGANDSPRVAPSSSGIALSETSQHRDAAEVLEQLRVLMEHCPDLVLIQQNKRIVYLNQAGVRLLGADNAEQVLGQSPHQFFAPAALTRLTEQPQQLTELQMLRRDGTAFDVEMFAVPIRYLGQVAVQLVARDISARKAAEQARAASDARFTGIISSAMDAIISINQQQEIVLFNPAAERMFGYRADEVIGHSIARLIPASLRAAHAEHVQRFGATGTTTRGMNALGAVSGLRQSGEEFPIEAAISQTHIQGEKFYTVILRDITRRKQAEEQLREQAALLNHAREAIIVISPAEQVIFWNHGAERLYGWQAAEVLGQPLKPELCQCQAEQRAAARQVLFAKGEWSGEIHQLTRDGMEIIVASHCTLVRDANGHHKSTLIINSDITEQKSLEAQFLRAQRMESIGTLAGGIAHDLNNILSPISMGLQMMQMKYADDYSQKMLGMMNVNVQRGAEMVKQILQFARGVSGERVAVQLKHLIKDTHKMLAETLPKSIALKLDCASDAALVLGDATQLHQVLLNLCVNARDAMPAGGVLTITLANELVPAGFPGLTREARPGMFAVITVTDTGEGIVPENLERIFDPFFTTKEQGKGTGLGLSTVFGIVRAHGGFITVNSAVGKGTTFKVYLPAMMDEPAPSVESQPHDLPAGQGELILVVDDEAAIREMHRATLEAHGYRVLTANDGAAALALYERHQREAQLIVTDLEMPVMDGKALLHALQSLNAALPIIFCSGSSDAEEHERLAQLGSQIVLAKPLNLYTLLRAVAEALHPPRPAPRPE